MATTINSYSVGLGMDASGYINGANLSRQETKQLIRDIEAARTPAENLAREQDRLTEALNKGAISQATYNRLLDAKKEKLGLVASSFNPYTAALTATTVAATAAVAGGVAFIHHLRDVQNRIDDTIDSAAKLGMTFNEVGALRFAAQEGGGVDAATVDQNMAKLQANIAKAVAGDAGIQAAFAEIGLNAGDLMKAGPLEATMQIADAFAQVSNQGDRLRLALEIFGKSGMEMVSTLSQGRDAMQESVDFQQKWNSLSDQQTTYVQSNNDAWDRVSLIVDGVSTKLAAEFAPAMQLVADYILDGADGMEGVDGAVRAVVDNTVQFVGFLKDAYELATVIQTTLGKVASGDFSGAGEAFTEAMKFDGAEKALDALNAKRAELESKAAADAERREQQRKMLQESNIIEVNEAKKKLEDEARKTADQKEKDLAKQRADAARDALKAASKHFEEEAKRLEKMRQDVAKGPGGGMEAGSAEAARFMADQVNKAMAVDAVPDGTKPTEEQLLEEARKQLEAMVEQNRKMEQQTALLQKLADKPTELARAR